MYDSNLPPQLAEDSRFNNEQEPRMKKCDSCNGAGFTSEHNPDSYDMQTGDHICCGCPIQVECQSCNGTGEIEKTEDEGRDPFEDTPESIFHKKKCGGH